MEGYLLLLLPLGLGWSCAGVRPVYENEERRQVPFHTHGRIPVIEARLNGRTAHFIIDTGASVSLLNEQEAGYFGFNVFVDDAYPSAHVTGFNGTSTVNYASPCMLELGALKMPALRLKSRNMTEISSVFFEHERIRVAGILGADLLEQYRMQIDFKARVISFK